VTIAATSTYNALKWNLFFVGWTVFAWWKLEPKISRVRESLPNPIVNPNTTPSPAPTQTEFTEFQFPVPVPIPVPGSVQTQDGKEDLKKRAGRAGHNGYQDYPDNQGDSSNNNDNGKEIKVEIKIKIKPLAAVTTWRAHMMLMTAICILAVDFNIFPRSLVKCETFGVSIVCSLTFDLPVIRDM
jgi:hypothetical protein